MTERMILMDFGPTLQRTYEDSFKVEVKFDKVAEGCVLVSVNGERERACMADLEFLAVCQRALSRAKTPREVRQVGRTLLQVNQKRREMNN